MAKATLGQWVQAMNPFREPRDRDEAERSARVFFVGALVGLVVSTVATAVTFGTNRMSDMMARQGAMLGMTEKEMEFQQAFMDSLAPFTIITSVGFGLILYGVLSVVQWRQMTRAIPIVMLAFAAYGLLANVTIRLTPLGGLVPAMPVWLTAFTWAAYVVQVAIFVASLRGATVLHRLRRAG